MFNEEVAMLDMCPLFCQFIHFDIFFSFKALTVQRMLLYPAISSTWHDSAELTLQIIVQIILNHSFFLYLPNFLLFAFALIFLQISHTDLAAALAAASYLP